jgi:hypothetical protein
MLEISTRVIGNKQWEAYAGNRVGAIFKIKQDSNGFFWLEDGTLGVVSMGSYATFGEAMHSAEKMIHNYLSSLGIDMPQPPKPPTLGRQVFDATVLRLHGTANLEKEQVTLTAQRTIAAVSAHLDKMRTDDRANIGDDIEYLGYFERMDGIIRDLSEAYDELGGL